MSTAPPLRVLWREGQLLRRADFADETAYHRDRLRAHLLSAHIWGIVAGLDLVVGEDDRPPAVTPGIAIDGYGRELLVEAAITVGEQPFIDRDVAELELWLTYGEVPSPSDPAGAARRALERPVLIFTRRGESVGDRRRPPFVSAADLDAGPLAAGIDDGRPWPVYLGSLTVDRARTPVRFTADRAGRAYAGLRAQRIEAPSGSGSLTFAASGPEPGAGAALELRLRRDGVLPDQPQLVVAADGAGRLAGPLTVVGDVEIGGALQIPETAADAGARPWSLYRASVPLDAELREVERLELPTGGTLEIGAWSAEAKAFAPLLTADAATGAVTVHGNLIELGATTAQQDRAGVAPGLSAQAQQAADAAFLGGLLAVGSRAAEILLESATVGEVGTDQLAAAIAGALAADDELTTAVAAALKAQFQATADLLKAELA